MSSLRAALLLARPGMVPWLLLLVGLGFGFAHWDHALPLQDREVLFRLGSVLLSWTALHVGTMWRNAARDRDEGPVLFGRAVAPPPWLARGGDAALLLSVLAGVLAGPVPAASASLCAVMAVVYSHPRTAWKGRPILGPLINVLGYGVLTPLVGWAIVGVAVSPRVVVLLFGTGWVMAGLVFIAQVFQGEEDSARGDRTLVVTHGPVACIRWARACFGIAVGVLLVQALLGWLPRLLLLGLPLGLPLFLRLRSWARDPLVDGVQQARRVFGGLVVLGLALVGLALVDFGLSIRAGGAVCGLSTAVVPRFEDLSRLEVPIVR